VKEKPDGHAMSKEKAQRLPPTPSVLKKLFAYSGNLCAMPDCDNSLVHKTGTMTGKVAHIHAAENGGARFNKNMNNEERRAFENLFIVCATCHDVIDDKANEKIYPARKLKSYKKKHEDRFRKAELQFLERYTDHTQRTKPKMPRNLKRLSETLGTPQIYMADEEITGVCEFIEKLSELPLDHRNFALSIADRMRRRGVDALPVEDVVSAFSISSTKLKSRMDLIEHHLLGDIEEDHVPGKYVLKLWDRKPGGNPWIEILDFCELSGDDPDEFVIELNFLRYDSEKS
jgi:cytochrome c553